MPFLSPELPRRISGRVSGRTWPRTENLQYHDGRQVISCQSITWLVVRDKRRAGFWALLSTKHVPNGEASPTLAPPNSELLSSHRRPWPGTHHQCSTRPYPAQPPVRFRAEKRLGGSSRFTIPTLNGPNPVRQYRWSRPKCASPTKSRSTPMLCYASYVCVISCRGVGGYNGV